LLENRCQFPAGRSEQAAMKTATPGLFMRHRCPAPIMKLV